ncbi:MAG: HAD-IA family hydrolase [Nocardioidaceae bacterium]|nr:HAD-IA family hydrolase [Nocardioidaceae bacterium]
MAKPGGEDGADCWLVVFDCDGVLVDSETLVVDIDVKAVTAVGWPVTREEVIELFVGKSVADMRRMIESRVGTSVSDDWDAPWQGEYRHALEVLLEPVDGVRDAVKAIEAAGYRTCVASSGAHEKMRGTLAKTGLWDMFEGRIFSVSEVDHGKPAPDLFLHAAATMGFHPSRCVVVEDSRYGVAAARAAGMGVIGYAGGVTPRSHLHDAHEVIDAMGDLPDAVDRLAG